MPEQQTATQPASKQPAPQKPNYMFDNAQQLEEERLATCNKTHNPHSVAFLKPFIEDLPQRSQVMEIGCGGGALAVEVAKKLPEDSTLHLIDRSPEQLQRAKDAFAEAVADAKAPLSNDVTVAFHEMDLVKDTDKLKRIGKMDLIYCRWVICHIPEPERIQMLANMLLALKPGAVFVLEDGDNTSVEYFTKDGSELPEYAKEAQRCFEETSKQICDFAKVDIQYSAKKQRRDLAEAAKLAGLGHGKITSVGMYRNTLNTKQEKQLLSTPWRTAAGMIFAAKGIKDPTKAMAEEFVRPSEQCDEDNNISAHFLTQSATAFTAPIEEEISTIHARL